MEKAGIWRGREGAPLTFFGVGYTPRYTQVDTTKATNNLRISQKAIQIKNFARWDPTKKREGGTAATGRFRVGRQTERDRGRERG